MVAARTALGAHAALFRDSRSADIRNPHARLAEFVHTPYGGAEAAINASVPLSEMLKRDERIRPEAVITIASSHTGQRAGVMDIGTEANARLWVAAPPPATCNT